MCSPSEQIFPGRLWSLSQMLRFYAHAFMRAYDDIVAMRITLNDDRLKSHDCIDVSPLQFEPRIDNLEVQLQSIGATFSVLGVRRLRELVRSKTPKIDHLRVRLDEVDSRISDELEAIKFYAISRKPELIEPDGYPFGREVHEKFADAVFDMEQAGRCLAFEVTTAAVFHLMRVLEIGIKATSRCLQLPDPTKDAERNWGVMLRKIKTEIERRNTSNGWRSPEDKYFFAEIYASLDAVKNVWRNATMHVEKKYTPEEAEHIWNAVSGFMRNLTSRCDEQGMPLA